MTPGDDVDPGDRVVSGSINTDDLVLAGDFAIQMGKAGAALARDAFESFGKGLAEESTENMAGRMNRLLDGAGEAGSFDPTRLVGVSDSLTRLNEIQLSALRGAGLTDAEIAEQMQRLGDVQLFRGTSTGFPGNPVLQRLEITPASTDPLVATVFSLESKAKGGDAVVLNGGMREFGGGDIDLRNVRSILEREVQVNGSPTQFAAVASNRIPADVARQVLGEMGVADLPPVIGSSEQATRILESTPRLTPVQIQEFLQRTRLSR